MYAKVPARVSAAIEGCPDLRVRWADHFGTHPAIVRLSVERFNEALADRGSLHFPSSETRVQMVLRDVELNPSLPDAFFAVTSQPPEDNGGSLRE